MLLIPGSLILVLLSAMLFGQVEGMEFCPQDFAYRSFRFNQIPLIHIQVTPVYRNDKTTDVANYLVTHKLLPPTSEKNRWDLTEGRRGSFAMSTSGAEILQRYLSAFDGQSNYAWKQWSMRHPEEAKVLWPVVAKLARTKQYPLVPEAFEAAKVATNEKDLTAELAKRIAPELHERAIDASENKRPDEARALWDLALELDPSQDKWRELRDALPPPAKAETKAAESQSSESPAKESPAKEAPVKDSPAKESAPAEQLSPGQGETYQGKDETKLPEETKEKPSETKSEPASEPPSLEYKSTPTSDAPKPQ